jgi:Fe-Mn family superoxide dismutase
MFKLTDLPYPYDALSPTISDKTLHFHHDKHHATYVKTLNELLGDKAGDGRTLEQVIRDAAGSGEKKLFNNAAQAWNHGFFWECMTPTAAPPSGALAQSIETSFGGAPNMRKLFITEGAGHFGSGWVWLVSDGSGKLNVRSTHDAEVMVTHEGVTPLIVCDLWEHAYYLDHQNDRKGYLEKWFDGLANWTFAADQLRAAQGGGKAWAYPTPDGRVAAAA